MAYFDCIVGGSGSGGAVLTVTCAEDFAGETITCTDNTTTLTKTCPSSSPYTVEFDIPNSGTWTISGTIDGNTYSTTVEVTLEYTAALESGFDWKTWVTEGGLDPDDYTDLDDVFDDETAVRRLMTVHDSADYLIECVTDDVDEIDNFCANDIAMKWIGLRDYVCDGLTAISGVWAKFMASTYWERILKDHVPVMTSDTAPYGTAITNGAASGYNAYKAFNGVTDDQASTYRSSNSSTVVDQYVGYTFTNPIAVRKIKGIIYGAVGSISNATLTFSLQGSNDGGTTWTNVKTGITGIYNGDDFKPFETDISSSAYYLSYRLIGTAQSVSGIRLSLSMLQFYGRALNVSVPTMTSNTAPFGTANGTSIYANSVSNYDYFHAFRGLALTSSNRGWLPTLADSQNNGKVYYHFTKPVAVKAARLCYLQSSSANPPTGHFVGSHNGTTWTAISETKTATTSMTIYNYNITDSSNAYEYVGFELTQEWNGAASGLYGLAVEIFGIDYSEREFATGSTIKYLYDHGVELETPTSYKHSNASCITEKRDSSLYFEMPSTANVYAGFYWSDINCSSYSLARVISNDILYTSGAATVGITALGAWDSLSKLNETSQAIVFTTLTNNLSAANQIGKYGLSIDLSNVSGTNFIAVRGANGSSGAVKKYDFNELWLE